MAYKLAISLGLTLVFLLSVFTFSVFADTSFANQPFSVDEVVYITYTSPNNFKAVVLSDSPSDYYTFLVGQQLYVVCTEPGSVTSNDSFFNGSQDLVHYPDNNLTDLYYVIHGNTSVGDIIESDIPQFNQLSDAMEALDASIISDPVVYNSLSYSLPPGNAIYIQVPSRNVSYTLQTRMPESVLGTNHYPGNNQVVTLVTSLPTGGSAPTSPLIPWSQSGALSVFGLSRNAVYHGTNAIPGYLCIVNPLYYSGTANGPYEFLSNGSIDITIDSQTGFYVYPLDSTLGFTSGLGVNVDTEILDTPFTGDIDSETGEIIWQDSSGGSTVPTTGGGNLVATSETIFDFLRNIASEIATFLKGPIQAIQTVVSSIREFLGSFTQLYTWLPSPVYNLITSALMIALTIGVIKIFV